MTQSGSYVVIVVGAGNAAICAALSATEQAAKVLVLERGYQRHLPSKIELGTANRSAAVYQVRRNMQHHVYFWRAEN